MKLKRDPPDKVYAAVADHLWAISELFVDGACLTFLVRVPDPGDQFLLITTDNLAEVAELLQAEAENTTTEEFILQ